jgi:dTDP-3-amino-3,4,6-trideoxy-alpha-D-glucose transaminase
MDLARQHAPLAAELRGAFERVLGASAFILGEEVARFEDEFAAACGADHCVGVGSGTAALMIMLQAAGIGPGDEVIVPAHTFVATAFAVVHAGAQPVCADVDPATALIDPDAVATAIGPRTAAILPVHLYGQVCAMDELRDLAQRHSLGLFEDAAQAHGASYRDRRAGALGDAAAFSFYPSKNLGALGDGGAITTGDGELAARARRLRDLGRGHDGTHAVAGHNERLDGLQAALLQVKLPHLDAWNEARRALAAGYRERLDGTFGLVEESAETPCNYHLFPIRATDRDALGAALAERGIATGVHYPQTLFDHPALERLAGDPASPHARAWAKEELSLPIFPSMTDGELELVIDAISACQG